VEQRIEAGGSGKAEASKVGLDYFPDLKSRMKSKPYGYDQEITSHFAFAGYVLYQGGKLVVSGL